MNVMFEKSLLTFFSWIPRPHGLLTVRRRNDESFMSPKLRSDKYILFLRSYN